MSIWNTVNDYYVECNGSTICKIYINKVLSYELWHKGIQYCGFENSQQAKDKYDRIINDQ